MPHKFVTTSRMVEPRISDGPACGPGSANHNQTGLSVQHVELLLYRGVRQTRTDGLLGLLQGRDTGQISARRYRRKILLQTIGRETREHIAILNLDRLIVLGVNKQQLKALAALFQPRRHR